MSKPLAALFFLRGKMGAVIYNRDGGIAPAKRFGRRQVSAHQPFLPRSDRPVRKTGHKWRRGSTMPARLWSMPEWQTGSAELQATALKSGHLYIIAKTGEISGLISLGGPTIPEKRPIPKSISSLRLFLPKNAGTDKYSNGPVLNTTHHLTSYFNGT